MTFYAELKRRKWYCINGFDAISWYRKFLYDEWYNSLTEEQKQRLEEYRKKKSENNRKRTLMTLAMIQSVTDYCASKTGYDWR